MDQPFKIINSWFTSVVCQREGPPEQVLIPSRDSQVALSSPHSRSRGQPRLSFLLGEACRSAPQTSGSAHLQAASPGSPTSCSILEARFSLPFPSLPKPASCLLWQREPHTISKKHKGKMRTARAAEPGLIVLALELTVLLVRGRESGQWVQS